MKKNFNIPNSDGQNPYIVKTFVVNGDTNELPEDMLKFLPPELRQLIIRDIAQGGNPQAPLKEENEEKVEKKKIFYDYKVVNCNQDLKTLVQKLKNSKTKQFGMLLYGVSGCHAKGEKVLGYTGNSIAVENIKVGDQLMGPDSTPRTVLQLIRGKSPMYRITFNQNESMVVNEDHILAFRCLTKKYSDLAKHKRKTLALPWSDKCYEMSVKEYLALPNSDFKKALRLYFPEKGVDFKQIHNYGNLPPYLLGLLLGDGCLRKCLSICTADTEISKYIQNTAKKSGLLISVQKKPKSKALTYYFVKKHSVGGNIIPFSERPISKELINLGLWNTTSDTKFIPDIYLTGTKEERLELLAGLLDTDGCLVKAHKVLKSGEKRTYYTYDFTTKSYQLHLDVKKLARSLGFKVNIPKLKTMKKIASNKYTSCSENEKDFTFYRLTISGNITKIPVKIKRKKSLKNNELKEGLKVNFKINKCSEDTYYGFVLDKDHLYLMDNYLVTHNCGKSYFAEWLAQELKLGFVKKRASDLQAKFVGETEANIKNAFKEAKSKKAILVFDEADSFLYDRKYSQREFEASSVNEMLTQMEDHPYPFVMTTNLKNRIDTAAMRRFIFKIKFEYMTSDNIKAAIKNYFGKQFKLTKNQLQALKYITVGDFVIAKKKMDILDNGNYTSQLIYEYLFKEQEEKEIKTGSKSIEI